MGIVNGFFNFVHRVNSFVSILESRASVILPEERYGWDSDGFYSTNTAGVKVNSDTALKQSAYWRAINLLSSQMASFPLGLFQRLPNGDTKEIKDHPAVKLLTRRPNNVMTSFIWKESTQANILINGNGYSFIERDRTGSPLTLKMLDSTQVTPKTDGTDLIYEYMGQVIDPFFMLHIPSLSFDGVEGKAILRVAAENMGLGLAMQQYSSDSFKNGAKQTGVLMHPGQLGDNAKTRLRTSFEKKMKGADGGTMILDEGMKWTATGIPPDQNQLLQSKQFSVQDLARWFGVPPYLLFEESRSTFTNIENQGAEFVRYTLTQWVERWEAELYTKLLTSDEQVDHFWKFNMNSLMRGSPKDRSEFYAKMEEYGNMSPDEVRRLEEMNKIPGGDKYLVQINREPLENAGKNEDNGE